MISSIDAKLRSLAESDYKAFNEKLIPTNYEILGIRMPILKKLAKEIVASPDVETYLENAEYTTYDHILLYGLVLGNLKKPSLETIFHYLDPLILKFDNWAHVDTIICTPKIFAKHPDEVLAHFLPLKTHEGEFTKRTFVIILMDYSINETYIDTALKHLTEVPQGQYYVDMAIAWAISLALVKFYDKTIPLLEQQIFSKFVHNKAIQKARESYRIAPEVKEYLNSLKVK
ncbi:3-methyladenine DNA glycosylase AlkD [Parabacteroides sp. PF5-5]|uniref:DNA alkylation repair protein n=1 Tax=unclassified Parabacteroides TaxID=2649774 RepID=UPI002474CD68|nr:MULTISPECIES: DNA alkylation repair protein [unclassified Parabacteroides]MDH6305903.1 3-methyladenine DNA glycosylase AlkD [Parabacteroides sp. PH5-39]MDH6317284.1 3-methyladenine DNA glycosylase AlkD [Parabacteroides sp. PF5-13]MDH6320492.1 3-methyladenine DNA glycosylase AlkD [Parabacteroides sp. PH5-13]MDH6324346.1 3-methyladenine DNA glycosylase AlkD [Parabacteroides sp. PH5-8]MDH6328542.1 3-methyladenine DNA glycosylase AlkD [Parabacteroides sp. PH5-41]